MKGIVSVSKKKVVFAAFEVIAPSTVKVFDTATLLVVTALET
jgi:hypothetical protein